MDEATEKVIEKVIAEVQTDLRSLSPSEYIDALEELIERSQAEIEATRETAQVEDLED